MRGVEATSVEEADGHARTSRDKGREGLAVCSEDVTAFAGSAAGLVEVKEKVSIVREESEAIRGSVGDSELGGDREGWGRMGVERGGGGEGRGSHDGENGGYGGELHLDDRVGSCLEWINDYKYKNSGGLR